MLVCSRGGRLEAGGTESVRRYAGEAAPGVSDEAEKEKKVESVSCSQDCMGVSGELLLSKLSSAVAMAVVDLREEIFLFFEEDVLAASCSRQLQRNRWKLKVYLWKKRPCRFRRGGRILHRTGRERVVSSSKAFIGRCTFWWKI